MNPVCISKCVLGEEEEEEVAEDQLHVCRTKCGTENIWSPCVIACKAKQAACAATCGMNPVCISKCVLGEEEEEEVAEDQLHVCRTKCGTENIWSPCVIACKAKQAACA